MTTVFGSTQSTRNLRHTCTLSPPAVKKENSHGITSSGFQWLSSPFCFIHNENASHPWKQTWVDMCTPTEYAHVKYVPCQAAHLTETDAKLRYTKPKSTLSKPIIQKIWRATDDNHVHSLLAHLVSDIGTLAQHLYSAKGIWRHLTVRFCFLRWCKPHIREGERSKVSRMLGTEITDKQNYHFPMFLNIPFRAFSYY